MSVGPLIIYHANCPDGHCAAWLLRKVYPHGDFVPARYGDPPPECAGRAVWIVDFSYPRATLRAMAESADSLLVIDHHKTAIEALEGFSGECWRDGLRNVYTRLYTEHSGARLTWDHLLDVKLLSGERPWLVDYTEDRDLWRHALPHSREINAALHSYPLDFSAWDTLAEYRIDAGGVLVGEGRAILRREEQIVAEHAARAYETVLGGHRILVANATTMFSEIAGRLAQGRPFGACWFVRADGKKQYSLRSTPEGVDVSEIAKQFGGGGHKHAAGFAVDYP